MALVRMTMEEIDKIWTPERIKEFSKTIPEPTAADYEEIPEWTDEEWANSMSWTEFLEYEKRNEQKNGFHYKTTEEIDEFAEEKIFVAEPAAEYRVR